MIRNSDEKYFEKARQAALLSNFKRTNIGCVAVYKGHIIAIGCNVCKTHPMQKNDIVNIGLHFFLKNVRPYAASCSEA